MALAPGNRIGHYEIVAQVGVGGMGEVYRAHDTKLKRDVALKLLPDSFATDPDRLARFQREAQVLASLNHPNIAHLHGLEESGGIRALVMELVEGEDLSQRIERGAIPLGEAVPIAKQIAEALEAAHEQGIIHRDLKPANIKVRDDGTVKVLDFGLAKALAPVSATPQADVTASPTITSPALMTGMGVILGTAAYMSPEQAKGRAADKRSDVWAFGCVLYEMLTGRRAFDGEDMTDVLGAVVRLEPNWEAFPPDVPSPVRTLLHGCLIKDRRYRVADMAAARFVLDNVANLARPAGMTASVAPQPRTPLWRTLIAPVAAAIVTGAAVGAAVWFATRPDAPRITRFALSPTGAAALSVDRISRDLAVLPDGSRVVYKAIGGAQGAAQTQLFVHALDQLGPTLLVRGGSLRAPFASPDGRWVGFVEAVAAPELKKVAVTGGPALNISSLDGTSLGATWGDDDSIIFATSNLETGLQRVSSMGGKPAVLTTPDRAGVELDHRWPQFLPGSDAVLFTIVSTTGRPDASQVAVLDLRTGNRKVLLSGGSQAHYTPSGHLVYTAAGTLLAVPFDIARLEVVGTPIPVVSQVETLPNGTAEFDIARNGTLVYVPPGSGTSPFRTLVWVDRQGREKPVKGAPPRAYANPRLSPDGSRLAVEARDEESDIWVWTFARETLTRVTFDSGIDRTPVWTPDGRRLVFSSQAGTGNVGGVGIGALSWRAADGSGDTEPLGQGKLFSGLVVPSSLSPDGTRILASAVSGSVTGGDVMMMGLKDRRLEPLLQTPFNERNGEISPDGRWLAYESNSSGRFEIYVRPFPEIDAGGQQQVSTQGGVQPMWARNGRELVYIGPDGTLSSALVERGETWAADTPKKLFDGRPYVGADSTWRTYDVSRDGQRFLMIKEAAPDRAGSPATIVVVQNWFEELKRLVPSN